MPELPEVEIARRNLAAWLRGRRVERVRVVDPRIVEGEGAARGLRGEKLREARRHGKWLLLLFSGGAGMMSHFGMTGKWVRRAAGGDAPRHAIAQLSLSDGRVLHYRDPRRFGRLIFGRDQALLRATSWTKMGPDALNDGVDPDRLAARFVRTSRTVKETLMDQTVLAGLGNIQVAEALFLARIHPHRRARSLAPAEVRALARAIAKSLARTLDAEASPEITYVEEAGAENPFLVYGRADEPCPRDGTPLRRTVLGGRATFFCPSCQPRR